MNIHSFSFIMHNFLDPQNPGRDYYQDHSHLPEIQVHEVEGFWGPVSNYGDEHHSNYINDIKEWYSQSRSDQFLFPAGRISNHSRKKDEHLIKSGAFPHHFDGEIGERNYPSAYSDGQSKKLKAKAGNIRCYDHQPGELGIELVA